MKKRVGILTSGGDCPGLNATIRGVAKALYARMGDNVEIVGILNGYHGLINGEYREMCEDDFRGILTLGGTILGTKRTPFKLMRVVEDDKIDKVAAMKKTYKDAKLDCLLCLGGNGTHKTANLLSQEGLNVIGLPKTIDNDIYGTDVTFGFHTAVDIATEVIDRIHTTAGSHSRVMCIEIMGNKAGWLTLYSGIAGGADVILLPEIPYDINVVADAVRRRAENGKAFSIVAVAEGAMSDDTYAVRTTLGDIYEDTHFVVGVPIVSEGATVGFVLAVTGARALTTMWRTFIGLFFMTAVTVLLLSFVVSAWVSMRQSRPIHEMAEATRRFAEGNFDVRMHNYEGVTEISELAESFNNMADSLQETERQRREFIANVSHELKTPMTTIAGYTDGILDGTIPPEQEKEYLRIISDEARRLSRLVRRMLEVSQLQSRDLTRTKAPFDVCESMRRVLISMEKKITDRGLDVDADIPDSGIMVLGDNDLITQVIYNLLENAAKFARKGSALYLGVTTLNGKALISVRNEGDTIPAEEIPLLFERFHKSDKSRSEDKDGVGLGLYVVKTILDQHKEHIAVTSENGLTTFTFSVTLAGGQTAQ